jgi:hypothetical protein
MERTIRASCAHDALPTTNDVAIVIVSTGQHRRWLNEEDPVPKLSLVILLALLLLPRAH